MRKKVGERPEESRSAPLGMNFYSHLLTRTVDGKEETKDKM